MPRGLRHIAGGLIYHVLNRGNGRMAIFHKEGDYAAFEKVLGEALGRYPAELLTYCLMPNHWHLVVRPATDAALSDLMRWIGVTYTAAITPISITRAAGTCIRGGSNALPCRMMCIF
jgi:putative transposase